MRYITSVSRNRLPKCRNARSRNEVRALLVEREDVERKCSRCTDERSEEDGPRVSRCGKQFLDPECRGLVAKDCEIQSQIEAE